MIVTGIEQKGKKKVRVYIDYEFAFETGADILKTFPLSEGEEIEDKVFETIMKEVIIPAAKKKAMDLLVKSDKSEFMLRRKLLETFCEEAVEDAIGYVKSFHYIDDVRFARGYYLSHRSRQSFMQIEYDLRQNGVSKEDIDSALKETAEAEEGEDFEDPADYRNEQELEAARTFLRKKGYDGMSDLSYEERGKLAAALKRKGFSTAVIRRALS